MSNPIEAIRKSKKINLRVDGVFCPAHAFGFITQPIWGNPDRETWDRMSVLQVENVERAWEDLELPEYIVSNHDFGRGRKPKFEEGQYVYRLSKGQRQRAGDRCVFWQSDICTFEMVGRLRKVGRRWVLERTWYGLNWYKTGSKMMYCQRETLFDANEAMRLAREKMVAEGSSDMRVHLMGIVNNHEVNSLEIYRNTQDWGAETRIA
jgi:hypothetical protein